MKTYVHQVNQGQKGPVSERQSTDNVQYRKGPYQKGPQRSDHFTHMFEKEKRQMSLKTELITV